MPVSWGLLVGFPYPPQDYIMRSGTIFVRTASNDSFDLMLAERNFALVRHYGK